LSGLSMGAGGGVELALGPQTVIYSELSYRYLELTGESSSTETLTGIIFKAGLRF
jgi:hypothetical protein